MPPCPAPDTCLALLIRHGATANNVCRPVRLQGRGTDFPLSPEGERQAEETGRFLAAIKLDFVYASPLLRAQQTAKAIASSHRLTVQTIEPLTEVDVGIWEGCTWEDIAARWPDEHQRFMDDPATCAYLDGESLQQVHERVAAVFDELLQAHLGNTIAVVTHNVVNRVLLAPLLGTPLKAARGIHQDNCGINVVQYHEGRAKLITLNSVLHLNDRY